LATSSTGSSRPWWRPTPTRWVAVTGPLAGSEPGYAGRDLFSSKALRRFAEQVLRQARVPERPHRVGAAWGVHQDSTWCHL